METISDLHEFMTENCYSNWTINIDKSEVLLHSGHGLKKENGILYFYFQERGNVEIIKNFKTEREAVKFVYEHIKNDKLSKRHCISILKSKKSSIELTEILKNRKIRFEQDSFQYAEDERRYRVFVFGCDVKNVKDLKDISISKDIPWTENTILLEYSEYTACKDIFQAVCDEIGKHYSTKGFKYSRSKPKITIQNEILKLEVGFSSSGSNTPGQSVNLQILPSFYSRQLKDSNINGYLLGHTGLFYHKYLEDVKKIRVNKIFGNTIERIDEYSVESKIIDSNNCNVYGLQKTDFDRILNFIDSKIIKWFDKIQTKKGILELIENASPTRVWSLNGQESNSDFVSYVKLYFPEIEIDKILEK